MSEELNNTKKKDIQSVDPRRIIFDPADNPRKFYGTKEDMQEQKASIRKNGVKQPIYIQNTPEGPKLIHGYRRMTNVMELIAEGVDIKYILCIPVARGYSDEQALLDHITLNSGKPLTSLEEAGIFKSLIALGWTQGDIGKEVGKTQGAVSNILKLADTTKRVQNYINEGLVSSSLVLKLIKECKNEHKLVEHKLVHAIESIDGTKKKVSEKHVIVKRVSKYHKLFTGSIEVLRNQNVDDAKIAKVEAIMKALDAETPEEMADSILAVL